MPFLYFGFFVMLTLWLLWVIAWAVVWGVVMLAWPIALLLAGFFVVRGLFRWSRRPRAQAWARAQSAPVRHDDVTDNTAFEEYRAETLRKLDEEQGSFREFLSGLRRSRDKQEFDSYMAARRGRPVIIDGEAPRSV